jgi:uncharacterized protein YqiB (DUF1249 family)
MLTDSAISLHRFAPPRSFAALMTLYESNYVRLRALAPVLVQLSKRASRFISHAPGEVPLHVALCDRSRYTTTLHMTYFFEHLGELVPDPDLSVRVYHDARMAEALACGGAQRHPLLASFETQRGTELERRWSRNMMLNKWLEYCTDRGHLLVAMPASQTVEVAAAL